MSVATTPLPPLRITIGPDQVHAIDPGLPLIAGLAKESLFAGLAPLAHAGSLQLFRDSQWLVGAASVDLSGGLDVATQTLYRELLGATAGYHLARIWNYVPAINADGPDGMENYRSFCRGRSLAFELELGPAFKAHLPSASAVGSQSNRLTVIFAATHTAPRHVENPLQVPAYDYPPEYGPRPPSFARATLVAAGDTTTLFVSGTSAVRGHATIAPDSTHGQLDCTLDNLRELSLACQLGPDLAAGRCRRRHFKVYLRHIADQPGAEAELTARLLRPGDEVSYVQADICRAALNIEIEATILGVTR